LKIKHHLRKREQISELMKSNKNKLEKTISDNFDKTNYTNSPNPSYKSDKRSVSPTPHFRNKHIDY
jgi:hypothetical protein